MNPANNPATTPAVIQDDPVGDAAHRLAMTVLMTPEMANFSGNIHGGALLRLADQAAYACASRYAGTYVVTLSVDQVMFKQPVHVGELVTLRAAINFVGRTSMEVGIKIHSENIRDRSCRHTNTCYFTMVAVDEQFRPVSVPPVEPKTLEERRWYRGAQLRRELRQEIQSRQRLVYEQVLREEGAQTPG